MAFHQFFLRALREKSYPKWELCFSPIFFFFFISFSLILVPGQKKKPLLPNWSKPTLLFFNYHLVLVLPARRHLHRNRSVSPLDGELRQLSIVIPRNGQPAKKKNSTNSFVPILSFSHRLSCFNSVTTTSTLLLSTEQRLILRD